MKEFSSSGVEDAAFSAPFDHQQPGRLRLRIHPDPALRTKAAPVERFDGNLQAIIKEMMNLMRLHEGIGLAAPQVGIALRIIVAEIGSRPIALANPEILDSSGQQEMVEGCLSLPGVEVNVVRKKRVAIDGIISRGKRIRLSVSGLAARVVQHEIDHLNGVLICDYQRASRTEAE